MKYLKPILLIAIMILAISGCENKTEKVKTQIRPGFHKYILSYTSGEYLSKSTTFQIKFVESLNDSAQTGDIIEKEIITFKPKIKGKTIWKDNRTIEFIPDEYLKSSQVYDVEVDLSKIADIPEEFNKLEYQVKIKDQSISFNNANLSTYGDAMDYYKLSAGISSADILTAEELKNIINIEYAANKGRISIEQSESMHSHSLIIDSLKRQEEGQYLKIIMDAEDINLDFTEEMKVRIPGLKEFELLTYDVSNGDDQYVSLTFSDPLSSSQNLEGMIYFEDNSRLDITVDRNTIKVIPISKLSGDKKLIINKGIKNALNYKLSNELELDITFQSIKPQVKIIGEGNIIPSSKGLVFPFEAVSLNAVDLRIIQIYDDNVLNFLQENNFDNYNDLSRYGRLIKQEKISLEDLTNANLNSWNTFKIDLSNYIPLQKGAIYRLELRFRKEYSTYACNNTEVVTETTVYEYQQEVERAKENFNNGGYYHSYYYPRGYNWQERDNPCNISYYNSSRFVSKNLLATDLGIIAKGSSTNKYTVAVTDLITANVESSVKIEFYNYQLQLISSGKTNSHGILKKQLQYKPHFLIAKKGEKIAYLKLNNQNALSLSNFDVSGHITQEGIKGFIYGERGVWRPGDLMYLNFILEDELKTLPENHPVIFEFYNPRDQLMERRVLKFGLNGFYTFITKTEQDAVTGNYRLNVKVGGNTFSKTIKVETIKPNRLDAKIDFKGDIIKQSDLSKALTLKAKWLHGQVAKNLEAKIQLKLSPAKTEFKGYSQYHFDNEASNFSSSEEEIFAKELNDKGSADFTLDIKDSDAPGFLNANFTIRVFEKSGDFSIIPQRIKYSPYDTYIGGRMITEGQNNWFDINKKQKLGIVSVDEEGKAVANRNVKVKIYKLRWRWWWESYNDNIASYISRSTVLETLSHDLKTDEKGRAVYEFEIPNNSYRDNGRYLIMIEDESGYHKTSFIAYFSQWYGRLGGKGKNSTMLVFDSDKKEYNVGEIAKIKLPPSKVGKAFVSIEKSSEVVDAFWAETSEKETFIEIPITKEMAPNVFINISLIQPYNQTVNDNPIRMYGVIQIGVEDPETHLNPEIEMPNVIEPEASFKVNVSEKNKKEMTYTIAIVDEGLLNVTGFKTPQPWHTFFAREALGIRTWDFYDYIIGAYGAKLEKAFAIGGGNQNEVDPSKNKANRFKPVVIYDGPYHLEKGQSKTHEFKMPNYVGKVRAMVVAGDVNKSAYGNAEVKVEVKKDLMVFASLPRVLGPREEVKMPVTVFAMNENLKSVKLRIETNSLLSSDKKTYTLNMSGESEKVFEIPLKVASAVGIAKVNIIASAKGKESTYQIELDVRNPNPKYSLIKEKVIKYNESFKHTIEGFGIKGTNSASVHISRIPPINLEDRLRYLISYPHGCIEQTTSSAFPQLFLSDLVKVSEADKQKMQRNIIATLERLRMFQLDNGSFSYWPGDEYASEWGTNYAGHFLLMAKEKGYRLPGGMLNNWLRFEKGAANNWATDYSYGNDLTQAYRLYLLSLAGVPELGAMNRMRENSKTSNRALFVLAGAYAEAGQKVAAIKIIDGIRIKENTNRHYYDPTFGSNIRDKAFKVIILKKMGKDNIAFEHLRTIVEKLNSDSWMSTQTTAFALMSIYVNYGASNKKEVLAAELIIDGESINVQTKKPIFKKEISITEGQKRSITIQNTAGEVIYAEIIHSGKPAEDKEVAKQENLKFSIKYKDLNGNLIDVSKIKQGTDFYAVVEVYNPAYLGDYHEMQLSQVFPSGWEILNSRFFDIGSGISSTKPKYQDIRDDRVYTYFDLNRNSRAKFVVLLNATYKGKYYLPAVICGAMYDNNVEAVIPGQWIEVIEDK